MIFNFSPHPVPPLFPADAGTCGGGRKGGGKYQIPNHNQEPRTKNQ